jgi:hypothetical protein
MRHICLQKHLRPAKRVLLLKAGFFHKQSAKEPLRAGRSIGGTPMPDSLPLPAGLDRLTLPSGSILASWDERFSFLLNMPSIPILPSLASALSRLSRHGPQWLCVVLVTTSCSASSCQSASPVTLQSASLGLQSVSPSLDRYIRWQRDFVFDDSTASSDIVAFFDPVAGFLVADEGQGQVRAYSNGSNVFWRSHRAG